ncbi:MAG: hypothetical protein JKX78_03585 [Alteromonadaceae bacterium]|nr:hypothetical protein [Alteromonadaceae bacterium]MBL4909100.1 hypothetical protein [Alteromonadaceae bacterium]
MSKTSKKCRLFKDGNSWCCVGPKFENIQESASGYGGTVEEAYNDYLADVIAMKAAKNLAKVAKKAKKVAAKKDVKPAKKFLTIMSDHIRVSLIGGMTPAATIRKAKKFNLTMEVPLGDAHIMDILNELCAAKDWLDTSSMSGADKATVGNEKPAKTKKTKSDKGSRNTRIHKKIVKAFKNGENRAGVLKLALTKNKKFNTPLPTAEVTDLVRVEWERLNPPSK